MNSAFKKNLCMIQLFCMTSSMQANWAQELKDIFKIGAIAGTSIFIYAKLVGRSKLVGDNSSATDGNGKNVETLHGEVENLKSRLAELDQKKDNRESEVTASNSVYERQNQADVLSCEEVERVRSLLREVTPDYNKLFTLLNTFSSKIVELTEKQTELEQQHLRIVKIIVQHDKKIKQGNEIMGNSVEVMAIADLLNKLNEACPKQHTDTQAQGFETYLEPECYSRKQEEKCTCSFQVLVGNSTSTTNSKVINFAQLGIVLLNRFLELNNKFIVLKNTMTESFPSIHSDIIFNTDNYYDGL